MSICSVHNFLHLLSAIIFLPKQTWKFILYKWGIESLEINMRNEANSQHFESLTNSGLYSKICICINYCFLSCFISHFFLLQQWLEIMHFSCGACTCIFSFSLRGCTTFVLLPAHSRSQCTGECTFLTYMRLQMVTEFAFGIWNGSSYPVSNLIPISLVR